MPFATFLLLILLGFFDDIGDDAPDYQLIIFCNHNGFKIIAFGNELDTVFFDADAFQGKFTVEATDRNTAIVRL